MASLWFENIAHQAVTTSLILIVSQMESPEDRYLSWVGGHGLEERPEQHEEQEVVDDQKRYPSFILYLNKWLLRDNAEYNDK